MRNTRQTKSGCLAASKNAKAEVAGISLPRGTGLAEKSEKGSWRTAQGGRQQALEAHGLSTFRAEMGRRQRGRRGGRLDFGQGCGAAKHLLEHQRARPDGSAKEAEVAHLHKGFGQHMLEEAVDEFLSGESAMLQLSGV